MKRNSNVLILIVIFTMIVTLSKAQSKDVFLKGTFNGTIYQQTSGLCGIGFLGTNNINSQLTVTNTNSGIPLLSLLRSGNYFFIDFDGTKSKFKFSTCPTADSGMVLTNNGNLFLHSYNYSWPARLNVEINYDSTISKTCIYSKLNTTDSLEPGYNLYLMQNGNGAHLADAITVCSQSESVPEQRVFLVKGNGETQIGGMSYYGQYGSAMLSVNGLLAAKEIVVNTTSWGDFVFDEKYKLMSINDLQQYIKHNNHLPGLPDAKSVIDNGYSMGEMDKILLQKIEELTLYIIELKKEVEIAKCKNN